MYICLNELCTEIIVNRRYADKYTGGIARTKNIAIRWKIIKYSRYSLHLIQSVLYIYIGLCSCNLCDQDILNYT